MPFWIYGRDANSGGSRDPLFIETEDEVDARQQAEEAGLVVDELELVRPSNRNRRPSAGARINANVILSTTPTLHGRRIIRYLGIVSGAAIVSPNAVAAMTDLTSIVGGRSTVYERELRSARNLALDEIESAALDVGANAIVGLQFQYEMIHGSLMVCVSGTAVRIEGSKPIPEDLANEHAIQR